MKYKILFYLINIVFNLYIYLHIIQLNIIIVNKTYFKNTLLIECQPPTTLEKFLYPPLHTNTNSFIPTISQTTLHNTHTHIYIYYIWGNNYYSKMNVLRIAQK